MDSCQISLVRVCFGLTFGTFRIILELSPLAVLQEVCKYGLSECHVNASDVLFGDFGNKQKLRKTSAIMDLQSR